MIVQSFLHHFFAGPFCIAAGGLGTMGPPGPIGGIITGGPIGLSTVDEIMQIRKGYYLKNVCTTNCKYINLSFRMLAQKLFL